VKRPVLLNQKKVICPEGGLKGQLNLAQGNALGLIKNKRIVREIALFSVLS